jgi:hypothetical protein
MDPAIFECSYRMQRHNIKPVRLRGIYWHAIGFTGSGIWKFGIGPCLAGSVREFGCPTRCPQVAFRERGSLSGWRGRPVRQEDAQPIFIHYLLNQIPCFPIPTSAIPTLQCIPPGAAHNLIHPSLCMADAGDPTFFFDPRSTVNLTVLTSKARNESLTSDSCLLPSPAPEVVETLRFSIWSSRILTNSALITLRPELLISTRPGRGHI